ncbi:hypothetical protein CALCODRAFT_344837 [Calocera cornea HHB12733]|uniref:Uncharacterized protein n=1 Tax=Calocera cornea HHB12733 TaxID=1353952 RepID=A0A165EWD2_9BASI|nr:hypothetical protein CALCODRAFT_344837 [Calocera cornea HHB12733]
MPRPARCTATGVQAAAPRRLRRAADPERVSCRLTVLLMAKQCGGPTVHILSTALSENGQVSRTIPSCSDTPRGTMRSQASKGRE